MFIDTRTLATDALIEADICIIGAGAAGVTLAREFAHTKQRVCLLESGGLTMDAATQKLQKLINVGRAYPKLQRLRPRFFGGATNLWGGHLVPLRAINFEKMQWIPHSGWPFGLETLLLYYDRAASMLGLEEYDHRFTAQDLARETGIPLFPFNPAMVESVISRYLTGSWNSAPGIGKLLFNDISDAPNITTYLHANVTSINPTPSGRHIQDVNGVTLAGNSFRVQAKQFVLATGGIENARLLLLSNSVFPQGIGNAHDTVGRFFMEHITYLNGAIIPARPKPVPSLYGNVVEHDGAYARCHIALPEAKIRALEIPDFRSEIVIARKAKPNLLEQSLKTIHDWVVDSHLLDSKPVTTLKAMKTENREPRRGRIVYRLSNYVEQVPNPLSRVTLASSRDMLGLPLAKVDWQLLPLDRHGIRVAHGLIAAEVEHSGFGRMENQLPEEESEILKGARGGAHHIGTTRMHVNAKEGVVGPDCRVHGMENMFIAGSSVFPTGGYANPTFTILAMAIRLADHLKTLQ